MKVARPVGEGWSRRALSVFCSLVLVLAASRSATIPRSRTTRLTEPVQDSFPANRDGPSTDIRNYRNGNRAICTVPDDLTEASER